MSGSEQNEISDQELQSFIETVKNMSAYDFTDYSDKSLKRRLAKVLLDTRMDLPLLLEKIKQSENFLEQIIKDITVNTTELFRDPPLWLSLRDNIIPPLKNKQDIKIWHAGCSTGQEVYSMMILLYEMGLFEKTRIYATDINSDVLESARTGIYKYRFNIGYLDNFDKVLKYDSGGNQQEVEYSKYLTIDKTHDQIKMHPFLSEKPVYKKMDLVTDVNPFPVKFDLIMCRNVIIYFNYELQNKVFKLFHDNLQPGGSIILGVHETILGPYSTFFEKKDHAYIKK